MTVDLGAGKGMHTPGQPSGLSGRLKLSERFAEDYRSSSSHFSKWRKQAERYYKAYFGDPWSPADKSRLEETDRPPVSFNLSLGTVNAVLGADQGDRKEVRFEGVSTDIYDTAVGEWLTNLARHQFNRCDGHRVDSDVFFDGLVTGMGFSTPYLDTHRFPFRMKTRRIPVWQCYPDPDSRESNFADARFMILEEEWTFDEIKAKWPKYLRRITSFHRLPEGSAQHPQTVFSDNYRTSTANPTSVFDAPRRVRIHQYQYKQIETWVAYTDPQTGQDKLLSLADFRKAKAEGLGEVAYATYPRERFYRAYLTGSKEDGDRPMILENEPIGVDNYTISAYTGLQSVDIKTGRVTRFGLMHVIYEPQMWSAKVLSMIIEMMARGQKGLLLAEKGALADPEQAASDLSTPGAIIMLEEDALNEKKIQFERPAPYPSALGAILDMTQNAIPETSGVTNWIKGTAQQERSNVLISNLQQQSLTMLNPLLDPMSGYRVRQGHIFTQLAVKYLSADTITKILGAPAVPGITHEQDPFTGRFQLDEQQQRIPIMDPSTGQPVAAGQILKNADIWEFDVQVDTGQASPTARQAFWRMWVDTALLQNLIEAGVPVNVILPELLKFSPLPAEMTAPLVKKLETELEQGKLDQVLGLLQEMSPEEHQQVFQTLSQALQGQGGQQQQQGAPPPQQGPPAGPM